MQGQPECKHICGPWAHGDNYGESKPHGYQLLS